MISRIIKNGFQNFARQGGLSFANIFIIFLAVGLIALMFLSDGMLNYAIEEVEDQIDISIFFQEEVTDDEIFSLKDELAGLSEVKNITYVSKEQAYESFVSNHEDDIYIEALKIIDTNPFLASLRIITNEPSQYADVVEYIDGKDLEDQIYKVDDFRREETIEKIELLSSGIKKIGYIFVVFTILLAILITFSTVRLSIFSQRKEIEIMKLVGASNWFIRGPFMIQGALCGILGGILSFSLIYLTLFLGKTSLTSILMGFDIYGYYYENAWILFFAQTIIGLAMGLISSYIAVTRYLRKKAD